MIIVFIGGAVISREIWLHVKIAQQSKDIAWIKRILMDNNRDKGGDE